MTRAELATYLIFCVIAVVCAVKALALLRVRLSLFNLPAAERGLLTILCDNNLGWCLTTVLVGATSVARALGYGNPIVFRLAILGTLALGASAGLLRLGTWLLFPERAPGDRGRPVAALSAAEELARLRLAAERLERLIARGDGAGGQP